MFMQVLAKAANGAAIGSTLTASSYLSRMHGEKGDLLKFFKKGDKNSILGRLETLQNDLKNTENGSPQKIVDHWKGKKRYLFPIIKSPYGMYHCVSDPFLISVLCVVLMSVLMFVLVSASGWPSLMGWSF
jgi:hypothetical protein